MMREILAALVFLAALATGSDPGVPSVSTAHAQSVSVSWELERGFRFFKYGSDFQFQHLAVMDFQAKHDKRLPTVEELDEMLADLNWWYTPVDGKVGKWFGYGSPIKPIELLREWRLDEISRLNRSPGYLELADRLKKEDLSDWEYHPARLGWASLLFPAHQTPEDIGTGSLIAASSVAVCWNRASQRHDNCDREDPYVVPTSHTVMLRAVIESSGERILDGSCIWKIQANDGAKFVKPAAPDVAELRINCDQMVVVSVPYKRDTRIDLQVGGESASATINVTDVLVVGVGDSFSSGEGNPDVSVKLAWTTDRQVDPVAGPAPIFYIVSDGPVRKQAGDYFAAQWIDRACHRSAYSYQLRSALQLALIDPTRAVTFLGYACSGAEVNKGLFNAFQGTEHVDNKIKMAQWRQAQFPLLLSELCDQYDGSQVKSLSTDREDQLIAKDHYHILAKGGAASDLAYKCQNQAPKNGFKRTIDLMYVSIGGNDLGFGSWLMSAITSEGRFGAFLPILKEDDACKGHIDSCRQTEARMKRLDARYSLLREFIDSRLLFSNRPVAPIIFYTYPLPIRTTEGKPCPAGNAGLTIFAKSTQAPKPKVCLTPEQGGVQVLDTIATFADRHLNGEIVNLVKSYTSDGQVHPAWTSVNDYQAAFFNRSYCASNVRAASTDTAPMEPTEGCLSSAQADLVSRIQLPWRAAQETLHLPIARQKWMPFDPIFDYRPYFHRSRLLRTMNETYFLINQLKGTTQTSRAMGVLDLMTAAVSGSLPSHSRSSRYNCWKLFRQKPGSFSFTKPKSVNLPQPKYQSRSISLKPASTETREFHRIGPSTRAQIQSLGEACNRHQDTYKVHLDGYNQLPYLAGEQDKSARKEFFYFNDDGQLVGLRYDNWKFVFCEQRVEGTLAIWRDPFVCMRAPTMFNLRMDPYERAEITSNTYNDWLLRHSFLVVAAQAVVGQFFGTFKEYPPRQRPSSFSVDQIMEQMEKPQTD